MGAPSLSDLDKAFLRGYRGSYLAKVWKGVAMALAKKKLEVGVKELKNKTTQIIRNIREKGTEYIITVDKTPVAIIMSLKSHSLVEKLAKRAEVLKSIESLSKEIAKDWDDKMNAAEAVSEQRRG